MSTRLSDDWFEVTELGGGLFRLNEPHVHKFFCANIFMLVGRDADLVIDFGMGLRPLAPVIAELASGKPLIAVATHSHVDHVGGFHEFADRRAHASEAAICAAMPESETYADMFRDLPEPLTALPQPGWRKENYSIRPAPLTSTLAGGDVIDLGDRCLEVLYLPGHSPGSIGLYDRNDGMLFPGDAIYRGGLVDDLPHSDKAAYRQTMQHLAAMEPAIVHGGHGPAITAREMREITLNYIAGL